MRIFSISPSGVTESATLPTRKAGLWELKTSMDEGGGPREQVMKMCISEEMERLTKRINSLCPDWAPSGMPNESARLY